MVWEMYCFMEKKKLYVIYDLDVVNSGNFKNIIYYYNF